MSRNRRNPARVAGLLCMLGAVIGWGSAQAQTATSAALAAPSTEATARYDIPAQDLTAALTAFARQSGAELIYAPEAAAGRSSNSVSGDYSAVEAVTTLLDGTGLDYVVTPGGGIMIGEPDVVADYRRQLESSSSNSLALAQTEAAPEPEPAPVADIAGARRAGVEEIIVTGQKKEERLQDVPIAISAFTMEQLDAQKIEGGFDLLKAIPNVTFSKTNFSGYNFQIRGVGTQSISATSDPGAAVALNNTAIIQNRLFEQEYLDVERVEVLRGPQGTLYGRNATAGVINVITNKPRLGVWEGMIDVEAGNYATSRLRGHVNIPVGDTFAVRAAYAGTERDGYTYNSVTDNQVDGRDLWTGRLSLGWQPIDRLRVDVLWEHFEEDDDRSRTGKQLCHRDPGPEFIGGMPTDFGLDDPKSTILGPAFFSQGCKPGSLYADEAFGTPNGLALPFVFGQLLLSHDCYIGGDPTACSAQYPIGTDENGVERAVIQLRDPYGGKMQSRDLREIASFRDPFYRASADLFEINIDFDLTDTLRFSSQTAYNEDSVYSFQDFNRFNTEPIFTNTSAPFVPVAGGYETLAPGGVFCDPQLGCSDTVAGFDISQADGEQMSQEFRLQSAFDGDLNFSIGANYTKFETQIDYYVFYNLITAMAMTAPFNAPVGGVLDPSICRTSDFGWLGSAPKNPVPIDDPRALCPYVDPNPIDFSTNFEGDGHNYFRSRNPYELESWAGFGEVYWNVLDDLKLTVGLRYTDDTKLFTLVPSQVLLAPGLIGGGVVNRGYPVTGQIEQRWGEWTGRAVVDWQPVLSFTDETLLYASYSRGYKGGGANPPSPGFATAEETQAAAIAAGVNPIIVENSWPTLGFVPVLQLTAVEYGQTFEPEFVNAFEIGTKNTLLGGAVMLNMTAFYYDYTDYQVSQIRDRTAVNENFDAEMWGLEIESVFAPTPDWQFMANIGYLKTRIGDGEESIDIMNRTQGNPDYVVAKPWPQLPSNCVIPTHVAAEYLSGASNAAIVRAVQLCGGLGGVVGLGRNVTHPMTGMEYDVANYPELNGGAGLRADLSGNELPQSPHLTVSVGGQHSFDMTQQWRGTIRLDYYWQGESYHRVYNLEPYDRLKAWSNTNLSFWVNNGSSGVTIEAYVKNLFNETPITGAFLNSDDTALTTNIFTFDPRLIGVSIRKEF